MTSSPIPRRGQRPLPPFVKMLSATNDLDLYLGRAEICQQVVGLEPAEESFADLTTQARRDAERWFDLPDPENPQQAPAGGWSWSLVAPNQLPLAIRVTALASQDEARRDAQQFLRGAQEVQMLDVHSHDDRQHGAWLVRDRTVWMVGGRLWRRPNESLRKGLGRLLRGHGGLLDSLAS